MTPVRVEERDCARCGYPESQHWAVNFANGPLVSGTVLICPTAVFLQRKGKRKVGGWAAAMDDKRPK